MRERAIVVSAEARNDLFLIYDWIARAATPQTALNYVERIERFCAQLAVGAERGTLRDAVRPGLRTLGFERRATIAFTVDDDRVTILRVLYGGRDLQEEMRNEKPHGDHD